MGATRSDVRDSLWGLLEFGAGPALSLLVTPLLLRQLGTPGYGVFAFAVALAGFGAVASLGASVAATKLISGAAAGRDRAQIQEVTSAGLVLCALGVALFVGASALFLGLGGGRLLGSLDGVASAPDLAAAAIALFGAQQLNHLYAGCLKGIQAFRENAQLEALAKLAVALAVVLVAWQVKEPLGCVLAQAVAVGTFALLKALRFGQGAHVAALRPKFRAEVLRKVFAFSKWPWLESVGGSFFNAFDRVVVGAVLGPAALAIYTICVQVGQLLHTVVVALLQRLLPSVSGSLAVGDEDAVRAEIKAGVLLNALFALAAAGFFLFFSESFLSLWLGRAVAAESAREFQLTVLAFVLLCLAVAPHFSLLGLGMPRAVAAVNVLGGVLMLGSLWALLGTYGLQGAAAARAAYGASVLLLYPILGVRLSRSPIAYPFGERGGS